MSYRAFWQRRCRAAAAEAVLKPLGGNCAVMPKNFHGQNEVNQVKMKTLVPLITFLLGICLISLIVYKTDTHEKEQRHITAQLNVATYGEQIKVAGEKILQQLCLL